MLGLKKNWVKTIAKAATEAAALASSANFIRITPVDGGREVRVQMFLGGEPKTWINYDAEQLDELIRIAQAMRDDMRHHKTSS